MAAPAWTAEEEIGEERLSIYRTCRRIKRKDNSIYNALRSIYEDSIFVGEIAGIWPQLPLVGNLRCGLWYSPRFESTCYFKSTDGHTNNWAFSTARLNLHLALLAGQRGGCIIVDSTRKGKRFPDSMSKTIPIWACVLNRVIEKRLKIIVCENLKDGKSDPNGSPNQTAELKQTLLNWNSSLHLPLWVPNTEKVAVEDRLEEWTRQLEACGADVGSLTSHLKKPLRPLWISQNTLIWLNEVPELSSWNFTPIILVSASASNGMPQQRTTSEFSWQYIAGAGDDEESWARGLSPNLFWKHAFDLIDSCPDLCKKRVHEIVETDRVYRAQRGEFSPQVIVKPQKMLTCGSSASCGDPANTYEPMDSKSSISSMTIRPFSEECSLSWFGTTNLAVGSIMCVPNALDHVDCILNCDSQSTPFSSLMAGAYLHLPTMTSKLDRFSLIKNLPAAVDFAKLNLNKGNKLLVCCDNGEDISICVCLAILSSLFDEKGIYDGGKSFMRSPITKLDMRKQLVYICTFAITARPSRGNLRQVFGFLSREKEQQSN